jgi:hypothetical protein
MGQGAGSKPKPGCFQAVGQLPGLNSHSPASCRNDAPTTATNSAMYFACVRWLWKITIAVKGHTADQPGRRVARSLPGGVRLVTRTTPAVLTNATFASTPVGCQIGYIWATLPVINRCFDDCNNAVK